MAIVFQETQSADAAATSVSVTITLAAGNAVIVVLLTLIAPVQTAGATLTQDANNNQSGDNMYVFSRLNVAGGADTFTFTVASGGATIFATEVSGLLTSGAFNLKGPDQTLTTATTHSTGTTASTAQADEFLIAAMHCDGAGTTSFTSVSNSFIVPTNGNKLGAGISDIRGIIAYRIVSAISTYETTFTTASVGAHAIIAAYKGTASAGRTAKNTEIPRGVAKGLNRGFQREPGVRMYSIPTIVVPKPQIVNGKVRWAA